MSDVIENKASDKEKNLYEDLIHFQNDGIVTLQFPQTLHIFAQCGAKPEIF